MFLNVLPIICPCLINISIFLILMKHVWRYHIKQIGKVSLVFGNPARCEYTWPIMLIRINKITGISCISSKPTSSKIYFYYQNLRVTLNFILLPLKLIHVILLPISSIYLRFISTNLQSGNQFPPMFLFILTVHWTYSILSYIKRLLFLSYIFHLFKFHSNQTGENHIKKNEQSPINL